MRLGKAALGYNWRWVEIAPRLSSVKEDTKKLTIADEVDIVSQPTDPLAQFHLYQVDSIIRITRIDISTEENMELVKKLYRALSNFACRPMILPKYLGTFPTQQKAIDRLRELRVELRGKPNTETISGDNMAPIPVAKKKYERHFCSKCGKTGASEVFYNKHILNECSTEYVQSFLTNQKTF